MSESARIAFEILFRELHREVHANGLTKHALACVNAMYTQHWPRMDAEDRMRAWFGSLAHVDAWDNRPGAL